MLYMHACICLYYTLRLRLRSVLVNCMALFLIRRSFRNFRSFALTHKNMLVLFLYAQCTLWHEIHAIMSSKKCYFCRFLQGATGCYFPIHKIVPSRHRIKIVQIEMDSQNDE